MPASRSAQPPEARKLPKQARSGATVDAILQAAAELLDGGSADDYTTNQIAERAGLTETRVAAASKQKIGPIPSFSAFFSRACRHPQDA